MAASRPDPSVGPRAAGWVRGRRSGWPAALGGPGGAETPRRTPGSPRGRAGEPTRSRRPALLSAVPRPAVRWRAVRWRATRRMAASRADPRPWDVDHLRSPRLRRTPCHRTPCHRTPCRRDSAGAGRGRRCLARLLEHRLLRWVRLGGHGCRTGATATIPGRRRTRPIRDLPTSRHQGRDRVRPGRRVSGGQALRGRDPAPGGDVAPVGRSPRAGVRPGVRSAAEHAAAVGSCPPRVPAPV